MQQKYMQYVHLHNKCKKIYAKRNLHTMRIEPGAAGSK